MIPCPRPNRISVVLSLINVAVLNTLVLFLLLFFFLILFVTGNECTKFLIWISSNVLIMTDFMLRY